MIYDPVDVRITVSNKRQVRRGGIRPPPGPSLGSASAAIIHWTKKSAFLKISFSESKLLFHVHQREKDENTNDISFDATRLSQYSNCFEITEVFFNSFLLDSLEERTYHEKGLLTC